MNISFENIINFLNISPAVYIASVLYTIACFTWMRTLAASYKKHSEWIYVIIIIINGMIPTVLNVTVKNNLYHFNPVYIIMIMPVFMTLEFMLISRDKLKVYLFHVCTIMLHLACFYGIAASIITSMNYNAGFSTDMNRVYSATITLTMMFLFASLNIQAVVLRNYAGVLRKVLYDENTGYSVAFIFIIINGIFMGFLTGIDYNVYFSGFDAIAVRKAAILGMLLRYILILVTSIIIILVQCKTELERERAKNLTTVLTMEKKRREAENINVLLEFSVNISRNFILRGMDYFSPEIWKEKAQGSYSVLLDYFVKNIVHPQDLYVFDNIGLKDDQTGDSEDNRLVKITFRYNVQEFKKLIDPGKDIHMYLENLDKEYAFGEIMVSYVLDEESGDLFAYVKISDVDADEQKKASLEVAAKMDPLTGLYNRAAMVKEIEQRLEDKKSALVPGGALFMLDLDHFKEINDNFGHPEGDALIRKAADVIKSAFREEDVVGRLGGDEFTVFMNAAVGSEVIRSKAANLNEKLHFSYKKTDGSFINTSVSIGIAMRKELGENYEELYHRADNALYKAKEQGRNTFVLDD